MVFGESLQVIELIPNAHALPIFKTLSKDCGHRYAAVVGEANVTGGTPSGPADWRLDLESLQDALSRYAA